LPSRRPAETKPFGSGAFIENLNTVSTDLQYSFKVGTAHQLTLGGGYRAAGTCQQRNGDRACCEMHIRPTHNASRTLALQLPISIPDLVPVSHLIRRGSRRIAKSLRRCSVGRSALCRKALADG